MPIIIEPIMKLEDIEFYKHLKKKESPFLHNIKELVQEKTQVLANEIPKIFDTYTIHDISHSFRILQHCYHLVEDKLDKLNELDIIILMYSAILHDIGMAVSAEELEEIKKPHYSYNNLKFSAMLTQRNQNEKLALQDFIRTIHADRANDYVLNDAQSKYLLPKQEFIDIREEVGKVCASHGKDFNWIMKNLSSETMKGSYTYNLQFCSFLLRLGDLLDFDSNRTPPILYKMINPTGYSNTEWKQHFLIKNFQKVLPNELQQKTITIIGESEDPKVHRKFLQYTKWIENEILAIIQAMKAMPKKYYINLNPFLDIQISTKGYSFSDKKLSIDYQAITKLLMGEKIYGDRKLALREIIQNSIDACKIRLELENKKSQYGDEPFRAVIKVLIDKSNDAISIKDNGLGMSMEIVNNYFLNIGRSYYTSEKFLLEEYDYKPIGNFGIGFLACFMLSDNIQIQTRYINSENKISITLEKESEYITLKEEQDVRFFGTEIFFKYNSFMKEFKDDIKQLISFLTPLFLPDNFELQVIDKDGYQTHKINNSIELEKATLNEKEYILPINSYLQGFEGSVKIKLIDKYIQTLDDIDYIDQAFICIDTPATDDEYASSCLQKIDNSYDLKKLHRNDQFSYIAIPIITEKYRDMYDNYCDVLDGDEQEVINKLSQKVDSITIFYTSEDETYTNFGIINSRYDEVISNISFHDLLDFGQDRDRSTNITIHNKKCYYNNNSYIPFGNKKYPSYFWSDKKCNIFLRNILIQNYKFRPKNLADIFDVQEIKINILNKNVIPNISRNHFDDEMDEKLNYAITKAIHLSALDHIALEPIKKAVLKNFIDTYFKETTDLE